MGTWEVTVGKALLRQDRVGQGPAPGLMSPPLLTVGELERDEVGVQKQQRLVVFGRS